MEQRSTRDFMLEAQNPLRFTGLVYLGSTGLSLALLLVIVLLTPAGEGVRELIEGPVHGLVQILSPEGSSPTGSFGAPEAVLDPAASLSDIWADNVVIESPLVAAIAMPVITDSTSDDAAMDAISSEVLANDEIESPVELDRSSDPADSNIAVPTPQRALVEEGRPTVLSAVMDERKPAVDGRSQTTIPSRQAAETPSRVVLAPVPSTASLVFPIVDILPVFHPQISGGLQATEFAVQPPAENGITAGMNSSASSSTATSTIPGPHTGAPLELTTPPSSQRLSQSQKQGQVRSGALDPRAEASATRSQGRLINTAGAQSAAIAQTTANSHAQPIEVVPKRIDVRGIGPSVSGSERPNSPGRPQGSAAGPATSGPRR